MLSPRHSDTHYYLGLIQQSPGEFLDAAEYFEQAVELDANQTRYHQGLGKAYGTAAQNASFFKQMRLVGKVKGTDVLISAATVCAASDAFGAEVFQEAGSTTIRGKRIPLTHYTFSGPGPQ